MAKYSKKLTNRIVELLKSDTYTIVEICRMCNITPFTYHYWIKNHPEFAEVIQEAKDERMQLFVLEARKSLLKKIQGYEVEEKKTVTVDSGKKNGDGNPVPKIKEQTIIKKHIQPDTVAIIFVLTNGAPDEFKNRQFSEVTGKDGKDLIPARVLTKAEAKEFIQKLEDEF
ncbi:MAG: hypothetical protein LBJ63_07905 [Prevotellaceae bacterium]|jgi:transposase-like protein|nr:hypothetical protein [Prevotellaceae bacterium]